ncbi:Cna B-type domain-containing protein [Streptococcus gallolyticus]|uniref:Cna B-type domain-containing protein n=1 Tax=Streptococcus gallolyticus TaxID=315405 RepID=UPI002DDD9270|nr:Cna B-type domain-containing protein [Streptococcus gallolyticus]
MIKLRKILIALLLLFSSIFSARTVLADNVDITVSNTSLSTNTITGGGTTQFSFDFAVPNSAKSGDTTVISLPDELNFQRSQTFNVYASDGTTVVATGVIDTTTKTLTLTYTDYVDTHDDVTGHIDLQIVVDRTVVTESKTVPATISVNGNTVTIDSDGIGYGVGTGDGWADFYKYGVYNYETNEITYRINVNTTLSTQSNVVITDTINSPGLEYVDGSFVIYEGDWYRNSEQYWALGSAVNVTNNYDISISSDNTSFSINLGNISRGYSIVYKVKANYDLVNGEQIKNSAIYYSENEEISHANNTVYYQSASGTANGYNYSLTVQKVNESGEALAGAEFTVTRESTGQVVGTITTGADGTATIGGLLKDNYIITETKAPIGYAIADPVTAEANNSTVTVTDKKATVEVTGTKTWDDNNNQDGLRPESITVNLLANGTVVDTKTVTADDNWTYTFSDLDQYDTDGNDITYTVSEETVAGYTTAVDGYNITNTHTSETTEVSGTKTWDDNDDQDGKRPDSITVNLLADGTVVDSQTVTADSNWSYSFTDLPKYANGSEIVYTVTEDAVDDYTTTYDGYNITNSYTPGETSITVTKVWDDNDDQDGIRPDTIQVQLYANGKKSGDAITLTAADNWTYTWTGLAEKANKQDITYTVEEVSAVDGYATITGVVENGNVTITNVHNPSTTSLTVDKVWDDNNDQDGIRPTSVTINLLANGEVVDTVDVTPNADGNWTYTFSDLAEYSNGKKVTYTVEEANTPEGYTSSVDGTTITNTHTPETTEVSGTKNWNDNDDQDGKRPDSITVNLLANGTVVDTKTVTADDNWSYSFTDLPKYADGNEITYTVSEEAVADYTTTYDGYNITNSYTPGETSITVTKVWNDNDDQDGLRQAVDVELYADGVATGQIQTLSADNNWTATWTGLAEKANKKAITYTVEEVTAIDGYTSETVQTASNNFTITNTHTPETTEVSGTKVWDDNDDQDGIRPDSITIELLANGESTGNTQTVSADTNWEYTFKDVPKYANGQEVTYTVREVNIPDGYTSSVDGTTITNTHVPETTEVSGTKTWNDNDNAVGLRPSAITVNLLANGTKVASQEVTADSDWNYSFTDLPKYANGNEITYTVTEDTVANYTPTYDGYNITNDYTPGKTSITVTKVWDDNGDQDGIRPDTIQVQLYANGKKSGDAITLTAADNWTYTWTGLDENLTYTVKEVSDVEGYTATVGDVENGNVTITNTHTPTTPDKPSSDEPTTPSQSNKKSDKEQDKNIIAALLPSTGSRSGLELTILGLVLVIALLAGLVYHKVKKA